MQHLQFYAIKYVIFPSWIVNLRPAPGPFIYIQPDLDMFCSFIHTAQRSVPENGLSK